MAEKRLAGGNLNAVVRVAGTVRRSAGAWTAAVHLLLRHLEAEGFEGAPRVLGFDEQGREVLSFIEGDTDSSGELDWIWSTEALVEAGNLIRRYHEACRSFTPPENVRWQVMVGAPSGGEIVCHNDLAPFNTVYRDGLPHAFLDWDLAAPGPPIWDIAGAAWKFVPLYPNRAGKSWPIAPGLRAERLRIFCDAYALDDRRDLLPIIGRRISASLRALEVWGGAGIPGWAEMAREPGHGQAMVAALALLEEQSEVFEKALR